MRLFISICALLLLASLAFAQMPKQEAKKPSEKAEPQEKPAAPKEENVVKGKEILKKTLGAMGGKALLDIKDITQSMAVTTTTPQGDIQIDIDMTFAAPNKMTQKMTMPFGEMRVGFDGKKGWIQSPMAEGIQDMPEGQKGDINKSLAANPYNFFQNIDSKDYIVEYLAGEKVSDKPAHVISVTYQPAKASFKLFIDEASMLIAKRVSTRTTQTGASEVEEVFSDYREVNGVQVAFHIVSSVMGNQVADMKIISVKINSGVKDNIFKKPK